METQHNGGQRANDNGNDNETPLAAIVRGVVIAIALNTTPAAAAPATITGPARVVDGDTVVVGGVAVRLKGVDAAERGTERGENARRVMGTLVNGELTCHLTGERTHRREVGFCFTADGTDINKAIIASGAALSLPQIRRPLHEAGDRGRVGRATPVVVLHPACPVVRGVLVEQARKTPCWHGTV